MSVVLGSGEHRYRVAENWAKLPDGWDLRDVLSKTAQWCLDRLEEPATDAWILSKVDRDSERAALHVYPYWPADRRSMTLLDAAKALGEDGGIETLIVARIEGRTFGFLGEPRVNVLRLNLDLAARFGRPKP